MDDNDLDETVSQNITSFYLIRSFVIIPSGSRASRTMCTEYPKSKLVRAVSEKKINE